jgi:hypothetical protein
VFRGIVGIAGRCGTGCDPAEPSNKHRIYCANSNYDWPKHLGISFLWMMNYMDDGMPGVAQAMSNLCGGTGFDSNSYHCEATNKKHIKHQVSPHKLIGTNDRPKSQIHQVSHRDGTSHQRR